MERAIWGRRPRTATGCGAGGGGGGFAPMSPLLVLSVAVLATSYAGPIVRFAAAPALAIAFWRLALVLPVTGGLAVLEGSREQGAASGVTRQRLLPAPRSLFPLMTLSGLLLALHFWSWIASLRFTTVARSRPDNVIRGKRERGAGSRRCRGARPARAGPQHAAGGVRGTQLDGVRCDGCGTDADRPHRNELRVAPLPRHDGERCGVGSAGGSDAPAPENYALSRNTPDAG